MELPAITGCCKASMKHATLATGAWLYSDTAMITFSTLRNSKYTLRQASLASRTMLQGTLPDVDHVNWSIGDQRCQ